MKEIKKVDPVSFAIVMAELYAVMGLIVAFFMFCFLSAGASSDYSATGSEAVFLGTGIFTVIMIPVFYGIGGLIAGFIISLIYNFVASHAGGIKIELVDVD